MAKLMRPLVLLCFTGSSMRGDMRHSDCTLGSPAIPNCTMNPEITRKNRAPSKKPDCTN